jgi:hypothetical protein
MPSPETISNDLYRTMRLIRRFEERALELVAAGEIVSGIHPCIGQEAVAAVSSPRSTAPATWSSATTAVTGICWPGAAAPPGSWPSWPAGRPG